MAHLSTPSPTLTLAGVGRNTSRGSWELTPPPNVLEGLDINIEQEGQAILDYLHPSTSRATSSPTSARQLAARRDLMIRGLVNQVSTQHYILICKENTTFPMMICPRPLRKDAVALSTRGTALPVVAAVLHHHFPLHPLCHVAVHLEAEVAATMVGAVDNARVV